MNLRRALIVAAAAVLVVGAVLAWVGATPGIKWPWEKDSPARKSFFGGVTLDSVFDELGLKYKCEPVTSTFDLTFGLGAPQYLAHCSLAPEAGLKVVINFFGAPDRMSEVRAHVDGVRLDRRLRTFAELADTLGEVLHVEGLADITSVEPNTPTRVVDGFAVDWYRHADLNRDVLRVAPEVVESRIGDLTWRVPIPARESLSFVSLPRLDPLGLRDHQSPDLGPVVARKFAPELRFHQNELLRPMGVGNFLSAANVCIVGVISSSKLRGDTITKRPHPCPSASSFDFSAPDPTCEQVERDCYYALDVRGADESDPASLYRRIQDEDMLDGARPTVYWHYDEVGDGSFAVIQYWFLYAFNPFTNRHESDWETISIRLRRYRWGYIPEDVAYSSHHGGMKQPWPSIEKSKGPVVYVALNSHANYFTPGKYTVVEQLAGPIQLKPAPDVACPNGLHLTPENYDLAPLNGPPLNAVFGAANFVVRGRVPIETLKKRKRLLDPRARSEWSDIEKLLESSRLSEVPRPAQC